VLKALEITTKQNYFKRKLVNPLLDLLKAGITPEKLSLTVALGTVIGVIPVIGAATVLGTLAATRLKLNTPVLLLISYFLNPLQVLIAYPLIRMGMFMFSSGELNYTFDQMLALVKKDWLVALDKLWVVNLLGVAAWAILAVPAGLALYFIFLPVFRKIVRKQVKVA
jgi:uncharacterized protein (DUF2062 family)